MALHWMALAVAVDVASLQAGPEYRAWATCVEGAVRAAADAGTTPEDMPTALRQACPDERTDLADAIRRQAGAARDDAAPTAEKMEAVTGALLADHVLRYQTFYATGAWPKP